MRAVFPMALLLIVCLSMASCSAQGPNQPQSVGGEFGGNWIGNFNAQNGQPSKTNQGNDLWTWGGSPKGSIIVNGNLVADPYYVWKSLNYTNGWLGKVYVDQATGNPVYGFIDPYTGMQVNYYMDPKTGKPVYTNAYPYYGTAYSGGIPYYGFPYYSNTPLVYSQNYLSDPYMLPSIFQ